jgi:hypothetical protein
MGQQYSSPCGYKGIEVLNDNTFLDIIQTQPGYLPLSYPSGKPISISPTSLFVPLSNENEKDSEDVTVLTSINTFSVGMVHSQGLAFLNSLDTLGFSFDTTFQLPYGVKSIQFFKYEGKVNYNGYVTGLTITNTEGNIVISNIVFNSNPFPSAITLTFYSGIDTLFVQNDPGNNCLVGVGKGDTLKYFFLSDKEIIGTPKKLTGDGLIREIEFIKEYSTCSLRTDTGIQYQWNDLQHNNILYHNKISASSKKEQEDGEEAEQKKTEKEIPYLTSLSSLVLSFASKSVDTVVFEGKYSDVYFEKLAPSPEVDDVLLAAQEKEDKENAERETNFLILVFILSIIFLIMIVGFYIYALHKTQDAIKIKSILPPPSNNRIVDNRNRVVV